MTRESTFTRGPAAGADDAAWTAPSGPGWAAPPVNRTDGVLARRLFAYGIDVVVIGALVLVLSVLIGLAGVVTFGLTWGLYAILGPATAIGYGALTVGGPGAGTVGMRLLGVRAMDARTGDGPSVLAAGAHALMFYVALGFVALLAVDILLGLGRQDRRLGHDLLAGLAFVRR